MQNQSEGSRGQSVSAISAALSYLPDLNCITSLDGVLLELNPPWTRFLGYSLEEMRGKPFISFVHPDDVAKTVAETLRLASPSYLTYHFENRYRHKNGHYVWLAWGARNVDGFIFGIATDITPTKENETFLEDVQHQAQIGGWSYDLETQVVKWTSETYRIHGLDQASAGSVSLSLTRYHPDDESRYFESMEGCIKERRAFAEDLRLVNEQGDLVWVQVSGYPVTDSESKVVRVQGTVQDISKRKTLEFEREKRSVQLERIIRNSPGMVFQFVRALDGSFFMPFASDKGYEIYEISPAAYRDNPKIMFDMVHADDFTQMVSAIEVSAANLSHFSWTGRIVTPTGKVKWIMINSHPARQEDGSTLWDGVVVDVTKERALAAALEEQRRMAEHSARLASIGELAAGVGHEINNPLAIAMATLDLLRDAESDSATPAERRTLLETQANALERIQKIVTGLGSLARSDGTPRGSGSGGSLLVALRRTVGLVEEIYRHDGVVIELEEPAEDIFVACDVSRLQQIVMNLLSNARDALVAQERRRIRIWVTSTSGMATFHVEDTGMGMSDAVKMRIFDSFFTTKDVGKGVGLGLSMCLGIVRSCSGEIRVESRIGSGSTFHVTLPRVKAVIQEGQEVSGKFAPSAKSALLVEDEKDLRSLLAIFFSRLGFEVTTAASGEEALSKLRGRVPDLLLTDLKMPGIDGLTLLKEAQALDPERRMVRILATGGILTSEQHLEAKEFADACLLKPFSMGQLRKSLESIQAK